MLANFFTDLNNARKAEHLVCETLAALTTDYDFTEVGNEREYFHKGDIKARDKSGNELFIEVKDDSRIAETRNILCEDKVLYFNWDSGCANWGRGNMYSDYDVYCVVSQDEHKLYFFDFDVLKHIYKRGRYKVIPHEEQETYCYLLPIDDAAAAGALITTISY